MQSSLEWYLLTSFTPLQNVGHGGHNSGLVSKYRLARSAYIYSLDYRTCHKLWYICGLVYRCRIAYEDYVSSTSHVCGSCVVCIVVCEVGAHSHI